MKPLTVLLTLLALALAGAAGLNQWSLLALAALALAVRAIEELRARRRQDWLDFPPVVHEERVATIYLRSGRLVLRRRRA